MLGAAVRTKASREDLTERRPDALLRPTLSAQHEAHLPAPQHPPRPHSRFPRADGHERRTQSPREPSSQGPQAPHAGDLQEVGSAALPPPHAAPRSLAFGGDRRLRRHDEFVRAQRQGRRVNTAHFALLVSARDTTAAGGEAPFPSRLGLVVSRKVGGAVQRNRVKRLCRECFRAWPDLLPAGVDLVVIARPGAQALTLATVRAEWQGAAGLLKKRAAESLARLREGHHVGATRDGRHGHGDG